MPNNDEKKVLLKVTDLKQWFPLKKTKLFQKEQEYVRANDGITLNIYEGETVGLVGESGCGKSTTGRAILRLIEPTGGCVLFDGEDISRLSNAKMRAKRREMQIIFQDPFSSLDPRMSVSQIIEEPMRLHGMYKSSHERETQTLKLMDTVGLARRLYNTYPHELDGGRRQRIGIARALSLNPKFIVCDEPVSALDVSIQSQIINLLQELKEKDGLTYLFISHNLSVVRYISDRIGVMYLGNMVEIAATDELFADPRHPYTVALLSSIPTTDPDSLTKERIILEGNIPSPIKPPSGCKFHTRCYMACDKCKRVPPELKEVKPGHFVACHFADQQKIDENGNYLFDIKTITNQR